MASSVASSSGRRLWAGIAGCLCLCLWLLPAPVASAEEWKLAREDRLRDIRVFLKRNPDSAYQDVYSITRLRGTPALIEAILDDVPAMSQWAARVAHARVLRRETDQVWIYIQYDMPYPLRPRDVVVRTQRSREGPAIVIRSRAVKGGPPQREGWIRLTDLESRWRLTPLRSDQVQVELWGRATPGGVVPSMLYNYNLPDDAMQSFRMLRRMALRDKYQR